MLSWVSEFQSPGTADFQLTGGAFMWALQKYLGDIAWRTGYFVSTQGCRLCAEPIYHCTTLFPCCWSPTWITALNTCLLPPPLPRLYWGHHVGTMGEWEKWLNSPDSKTIWMDMQMQRNKNAFYCTCHLSKANIFAHILLQVQRKETLKKFFQARGCTFKLFVTYPRF